MRTYLRITLVVLVFSLLLSQSLLPAHAYTPMPGQGGLTLKWRTKPVNIGVNPTGLTGTATVSRIQWYNQLLRAVDVWNKNAQSLGLGVTFRIDTNSDQVQFQMTNQTNNWLWCQGRTLPYLVPVNKDAGILAATGLLQMSPGSCTGSHPEMTEITNARMFIRSDVNWRVQESKSDSNDPDPMTILLHELAHVLGMDESFRTSYNTSCNSVTFESGCISVLFKGTDGLNHAGQYIRRDIGEDDRCGLRFLYGTPCASFPIAGDADLNCRVDILDYNIIRYINWMKTGTNIPGDLNKDGIVNTFDFGIWNTNQGKTCSTA